MKKRRIRRHWSLRSRLIASALVVATLAISSAFVYRHYTAQKPNVASTPSGHSAKAETKKTEKIPKKQSLSYEVPANHPRKLIIQKLGVDANVAPMGILSNGALEAPKTAWQAGWYDESALPGSGQNALLIDGHVNDALNTPGIFYKINTLKAGDTMQIQRGDKQIFTYKVVKTDQKPIAQVDMAKMLQSVVPGKEGLNLITCGGQYDYSRETYNDRVLVYAVRIS